MAFFTLEDYAGTVEVIAFSGVYEAARALVHSDTPILVEGRLDRREDEPGKILAESITSLADAGAASDGRLEVVVPRELCDPDTLAEVRSLLARHSGSMPVRLTIDTGENHAVLAPKALRVALSAGLLEPLGELVGRENVRLGHDGTRASAAPRGNGGNGAPRAEARG
jgi:DNA polymerase-3 subunit alpha